MAAMDRRSQWRTPARRARTGAVAAAVAILSACALCPAFAARARWHDSFEEGLAAAAQSGRPIVVVAYISQPGVAYDFAHDGMLHETLVDEGVVEALGAFEPVLLDVRDRSNDAARRRLNVSPVVTPAFMPRGP